MHGHLVAVKVGVERRTDERMELDRLTFDENRLKGLNAETMEGRRAVEHTGCSWITSSRTSQTSDVSFSTSFLACFTVGQTLGVKLGIDERLEQFERHLLRQTALAQLEVRDQPR